MNDFPQFKQATEELEHKMIEYSSAMLEMHQHLLKTLNETCEARMKLAEAGQSLKDYIKDFEYFASHPVKYIIPNITTNHE